MFDLTVIARDGRWVLVDEDAGEIGAYGSRAEALKAAGDYGAQIWEEPRHVLILDEPGEWEEALVETPKLH
jgi:hypothetical protein